MDIILAIAYLAGGYMSVRYLKRNLLGVEVEIYSNALNHFMSQCIWGVILGWATIPIALLHYLISAKQYKQAGALVVVIILVVFFMSGNKDEPNYNTPKPPAHQTTTAAQKPKPKTKTKEKDEIESDTAETEMQKQPVADSDKEVYVGSYNDGTKVYILADTIQRNAGNFTCTVKAGRDRLHYRFDGQNYSNSEGYHGNINDGKSPVALNMYNYCTNGKLADSEEITWIIKLRGENLYVKNGSVVRVGDTNPNVAPEFKCVLIFDSGEQANCEFKARGMVVMFVEGKRLGDSSADPNVEAVYNAIVKKFF